VSIIEKAAKRLEELRRAGIEVPDARRGSDDAAGRSVNGHDRLRPAAVTATSTLADLRSPGTAAVASVSAPPALNDPHAAPLPIRQSRRVDINFAQLAAMGMVSPDAPRSQMADEFRVIKRPLLTNAFGRSANTVARGNLIMVTSSLPGEGKTFSSVNLALSIAMELDNTVLLVDADVARPSVLERLALAPAKGLMDVLTGDSLELADVLLRTNIERLSILPAGTPHDRATELLASESMNRLIDELASRYPDRILIFDAPPLLPSTESRVLATHMGQVILVVEAGKTPQASVSQALSTIESCPVVMTLLNKVARSEVGSYYGYYGNAA